MPHFPNFEEYNLEVDMTNAGAVWFTFWHDTCGQFLIDDYAQRMGASISELMNLAGAHQALCKSG